MSLRIAVFGATGVAGSGVLDACLKATDVSELRAIVRRPLDVTHTKLDTRLCPDFLDEAWLRDNLAGIDHVFFALGISVSQTKSEAEYRRITYDYALAAARALEQASPNATFFFVSGGGTNVNSRMMWARVKGEAERDLQGLGMRGVVCVRPGAIDGGRLPHGASWSYRLGVFLLPVFSLFRGAYIKSNDLGRALLQLGREDKRDGVLDNTALRDAADRTGSVATSA